MRENQPDHPFPADKADQPAGVSAKLLVPQAIERRWTLVLNLHEIRLLQRLCDLTVQWREPYIDTTMKQIVEGRAGRGERHMGPLGFGRTTADKALATLAERGLVEASTLINTTTGAWVGQRFRPNVALILKPWEIEAVPPTHAVPKRLKDMPLDTRKGSSREMGREFLAGEKTLPASREHNTERHTDTYTGNFHDPADAGLVAGKPAPDRLSVFEGFEGKDQFPLMPLPENKTMRKSRPEKSEGITSAKGSAEKVRARLEAISDRSAEHRATALQLAAERIRAARPWVKGETAKDAIRSGDIWTVWKCVWIATAPDSREPSPWTKADYGIAKDLFRRWPHHNDGTKPNGEFDDFLTWVVTDWGSLSSKMFGWMKDRPRQPSLRILVKFLDRFEDAFVERDRMKAASRLDIDEVTELRLKGMSYDQAITAVVQRKVRGAARKLAAQSPKGPPPARARETFRPLRPVAPKSDISKGEAPPMSVRQQQMRSKPPEELETELWGPREQAAA